MFKTLQSNRARLQLLPRVSNAKRPLITFIRRDIRALIIKITTNSKADW